MTKYTVWVTQANGRGTAHVSSHDADSVGAAEDMALEETCADWGWESADNLRILGIAKGNVELVYWNDLDE